MLGFDLQSIHEEVRSRQPDITSVVTGSEQFNRTNRERLPEKQKDSLSGRSTTLKKDYDRIYNLSDQWLTEAVDHLNQLKEDEDARVSLIHESQILKHGKNKGEICPQEVLKSARHYYRVRPNLNDTYIHHKDGFRHSVEKERYCSNCKIPCRNFCNLNLI